MVGLRSTPQDRVLLLIVWVLTLVVLVLGIITLSPILLVWGSIGLPAAVFLTYIHIRDTRPGARPRAGSGGARDRAAGSPGGGADRASRADGTADGIEEESSR